MAARQKGIEINTIKQKKTEAAKRREEHKVLISGATSKTVRLKRNINVRYNQEENSKMAKFYRHIRKKLALTATIQTFMQIVKIKKLVGLTYPSSGGLALSLVP